MKKNIFKSVGWFFPIMLIAGLIVLLGTGRESFAKEPIKIGYIGTFSAYYGKNDKTAIETSVEDLNAAGGILGRPVELVEADCKAEVPLAIGAYKKLVMTDKCLLVFTEGTEISLGCAEVASRLYPSFPHLQFPIFSASPLITDLVANQYDKYKFLFRPYYNIADGYTVDKLFVDFFKGKVGTKKLALMIEDTKFTELWRKGLPGAYLTMKEFYEKNGIEVVYYQIIDIKEKMFFPILDKIAASGADTMYWILAYTDAVGLVKQWAQSPAKNIEMMLMSGASSLEAFYKMTAGQALGVIVELPELDCPYTEKTLPLLKKVKATKGLSMSGSNGPGCYDSPWILKKAVEKVGSVENVEALIKALETIEVQHAFWVWAFNKRHDAKSGYPPYQPTPIAQIQKNGHLVAVYPDALVKITNPNTKFVPLKDLRK